MTFNVWTFLFEIVNFVVLAYVLYRLLYHPLRKAIEERREATLRAQADAEAARKDVTALEKKLQGDMAELERQRQEALRQTRAQADAERARLLADAEQAVQHRQEEARQALARERTEALQSLRAELIDQAADLAERFLREAANCTLNDRLLAKLIGALQATPGKDHGDLERWQPADGAVLEVAAKPDDASLAGITRAVAEFLGRPVDLTVQTQPELIAGARLRLGGRVWDASLGGLLREVRQPSAEAAGHG